MGIFIGTVDVVLRVVILKGLKRRDEGAMVKGYTQAPSLVTNYAAQNVVEAGARLFLPRKTRG